MTLRISKNDVRYPVVLGRISALQQVRDGDILICCGKSDISRMISRVTKSDVTHVGIIVWKDGQWQVIEAVGSVIIRPLAAYDDYDGRILFGRLQLPPAYITEFTDIAASYIGHEYDWDDLVKIWLRTTWLSRLFRFRKDSDARMYCSDHVARCLREYYKQRGQSVPERYQELCSSSHYSTPREIAAQCDIICEVV